MARAGDIVYLGGRFDLVLGQPRHNLAAVDLATGTLTDWNPTPGGGRVRSACARHVPHGLTNIANVCLTR